MPKSYLLRKNLNRFIAFSNKMEIERVGEEMEYLFFLTSVYVIYLFEKKYILEIINMWSNNSFVRSWGILNIILIISILRDSHSVNQMEI